MTKTILYTRTSHADQNIASQLKQAEAAGFVIDEVVADEGVSGISVPLKERPEGRRLFDLLRRGDVCVVRWLDRLGRNYEDVSASVRELMDRGVIIKTVINRMTFDGAATDPMTKAVRDALLAFMSATAEAQAEATRQAQAAGIALAREKNKFLGRKPSFDRAQFDAIRTGLLDGKGAGQIAKELGFNRHVVIRIARNVEQADATLAAWGA